MPTAVEPAPAGLLQQVSFWPEDEENGGSELTTMSSQLRKTRSMDSSCLELRLGPPQSQSTGSGLGHGHVGQGHMGTAMSRARSEANLHASTLSLGPGEWDFTSDVVDIRLVIVKRYGKKSHC